MPYDTGMLPSMSNGGLAEFIKDVIDRNFRKNFGESPPEVQMIIMILKGDGGRPSGPLMDRLGVDKPPLPRNPFQT